MYNNVVCIALRMRLKSEYYLNLPNNNNNSIPTIIKVSRLPYIHLKYLYVITKNDIFILIYL